MLSPMSGSLARSHPSVRRFRDLARARAAGGGEREILLDGAHLLAEAIASGIPIEIAAFEREALDRPVLARLARELQASGTEVMLVSARTIAAMSPVKTPSGVVSIARLALTPVARALAPSRPAVALVAVDVQDPGNVGALVRTAEAAGAAAFVAAGSTADPFGWKALRGSMGSALRLPIARAAIDEAVTACRTAGLGVLALDAQADASLFELDLRSPAAVLVGSEGGGLPSAIAALADRRIAIPMRPPVESLNVAVAAGLVLYEVFRQRLGDAAPLPPAP